MPEDAFVGETALLLWGLGALGAWYYGPKAGKALQSALDNRSTPAQQQSDAQQGAQDGLSSSSATKPCQTCQPGCPPCKTASGRSVTPGTIAYRHDLVPPSKPHYPFTGDHYNLY